MCKHRTAYFLEKRRGLSLLVCTTGCGQVFWKDETGREITGDELIKRLEPVMSDRAAAKVKTIDDDSTYTQEFDDFSDADPGL